MAIDDIVESKIECEIRLCQDAKPLAETKSYSAQLHLFEHRYDAKFDPFWYGVVAIVGADDELVAALDANSLNTQVRIKLPDGRERVARYSQGGLQAADGVNYFRLAVYGVTWLHRTSAS